MSHGRISRSVVLVLLMGTVAGIWMVGGQANDPTRVAVYAASLQAGGSSEKAPPVTSAVVSTMTDWGSYGNALKKEADIALHAVGAFDRGPAVYVMVALRKPEPGAVIVLKEHPLSQVPGETKNLSFSFSIEIPSDASGEKGIQTFNDLKIILNYPKGSSPFFLANNKTTRVYLKDMVDKPTILPGFTGTVKVFGENAYLIEATAWEAGDPCCSG